MQVGYWSVPLTSADTKFNTSVAPYIPGAWPYLLQGLNWAKQNGIHVILDLHGAPGSQNGYDNSGQRTDNPTWGSDPNAVPLTLDIIRYIANNVGGMIDVLELVNEAAGFTSSAWAADIREFFQDGYDAVREVSDVNVMIGDAFLGVSVRLHMSIPRGRGVV